MLPQAQGGTINSLVFDFVGSTLYTGDAQGVLREYALDLRGVDQGGGSAPIRALRSCTDMEGAWGMNETRMSRA